MQIYAQLGKGPGTTGRTNRRPQQRVVCVKAALGDAETNGKPLPPPLSLYHPFKSLPPSGQLIPPAEEACDITVSACKERMYVFETRCESCGGTGYARSYSSRGRGRGGRGSLHMCLVCTGIGHVRRTTARAPPEDLWGIEPLTLARQQRLPGEPEQTTLPHDTRMPAERKARLRRAAERLSEAAKRMGGSSNEAARQVATSNGPATASLDGGQQHADGGDGFEEDRAAVRASREGTPPANNIVSGAGLNTTQTSKAVAASSKEPAAKQ